MASGLCSDLSPMFFNWNLLTRYIVKAVHLPTECKFSIAIDTLRFITATCRVVRSGRYEPA